MIETSNIAKFATLDFEASSLSQKSWPIEIGLAWLDGGEVQTWSTLIRPEQDWNLSDWAPQSAAVHGITLEEGSRPWAWCNSDGSAG